MPCQRFLIISICSALLVLLSGCATNGKVYSDRFVQIPVKTGIDKASRIDIAQDVIYAIEPGLHQRVSAQFPTVTKRQLESLSLAWGYDDLVWGTGPATRVYIQINLTYLGTQDEMWGAIIKYCAEEVVSAIENSSKSSN